MGWLIMSVLKAIPNLWAYKLIKLEAYFEWFEATTYSGWFTNAHPKDTHFSKFSIDVLWTGVSTRQWSVVPSPDQETLADQVLEFPQIL
jgi:hypothetical protein